MARKKTILAALVIGVGAFLFANVAFARPRRSKGDPDTEEDSGKKGRGEAGTPRPHKGGVSHGRVRSGHEYRVPEGWDPHRGLWISADCEWVVEGPNWWNGRCYGGIGFEDCLLEYGPEGFPQTAPNANEESTDADTITQHMSVNETAGAIGWVDDQVNKRRQPEDIAAELLAAYAPMCADVDPSLWSDSLKAWYDSVVRRVVDHAGQYLGESFEPGAGDDPMTSADDEIPYHIEAPGDEG